MCWAWPWYLDTTSFLLRCKERPWRGLPISDHYLARLSDLIKRVTEVACVCVDELPRQGSHTPSLEGRFIWKSQVVIPSSTTWRSRGAKNSLRFGGGNGQQAEILTNKPQGGSLHLPSHAAAPELWREGVSSCSGSPIVSLSGLATPSSSKLGSENGLRSPRGTGQGTKAKPSPLY